MRRLISADINRIMHKKTLWISLILGIVLLAVAVAGYKFTFVWDGTVFADAIFLMLYFLEFTFGLLTFLFVYGDEVSSMALITAIGRGLTREKAVLAKFLDTVIVTLVMNVILTLFIFIFQLAFGADLTHDQAVWVYFAVITGLYQCLGYLTISALFLFITWNIPLAVLIYTACSILIPGAFLLFSDTTLVAQYHIDRYYYGTMADMALTDIVLGLPAEGASLYLKGFLTYVVLALILTILSFRKKELDF